MVVYLGGGFRVDPVALGDRGRWPRRVESRAGVLIESMQPPAVGARWVRDGHRRVMQMMTASECRQQSTLYMSDAKIEDHVGIRTTLLALNRSCLMLANQIERLAAMREAEGRRA